MEYKYDIIFTRVISHKEYEGICSNLQVYIPGTSNRDWLAIYRLDEDLNYHINVYQRNKNICILPHSVFVVAENMLEKKTFTGFKKTVHPKRLSSLKKIWI